MITTQAIFNNIGECIKQEISDAHHSIYLAVAWFTNRDLFRALLNKAQTGCAVSLIISKNEINQDSSLDYEELNIKDSNVYWIGDNYAELMHNKFCIIDKATIITGSYNWSYKAETNFENIVITKGDSALAEQFIDEFNVIRNQYFPTKSKAKDKLPLDKIIKRLQILKNYVLLEDLDEIGRAVSKLDEYKSKDSLQEIISNIQQENFATAVKSIDRFISENQQLLIWTDPEIKTLTLEIKNLENKLSAFENEKIELEKILIQFNHRHTAELGDIILEILKLRKQKLKSNKKKFKEAEEDEKKYRSQMAEEKKKEIFELTADEKTELKNKFRKASMLCHPDRVSEEFRENAKESFIKLKKAYDANDLYKVSEILEELKNGLSFKTKSETVTKKEVLEVEIAKLKKRIEHLKSEIISIKQSDAYKEINSIDDWDTYFRKTKEQLHEELKELHLELEE